jgi:hypothetical protein
VSTLHQWLADQRERACPLCGVSILLNFITLGLMACLHWRP